MANDKWKTITLFTEANDAKGYRPERKNFDPYKLSCGKGPNHLRKQQTTCAGREILGSQSLEEVANLSINLSRIIRVRKCLRDLRAQHFAKAAAQAVNRRLDRALTHLQSDGDLLVRQAVGSDQKVLQTLEETRFTRIFIFGGHPRNHSI